MMIYRAAVGCVFGVLLLSTESRGQTAVSPTITAQFASTDWLQRYSAFRLVQASPKSWNAPGMPAALLALLTREDDFIVTTLRESGGNADVSDRYGEGYAEYVAEVLDTCVRLCEKQGFLAHLLHNAERGSLLRFDAVNALRDVRSSGFSAGQRAEIDSAFIAAALDSSNFMARVAGVDAIAKVFTTGDASLPADRRAAMHAAVVAAASDGETNVRLSAVTALVDVGTSDDLPLLRRIAQQDTIQSTRRGQKGYPIREMALRAIARISPRQP